MRGVAQMKWWPLFFSLCFFQSYITTHVAISRGEQTGDKTMRGDSMKVVKADEQDRVAREKRSAWIQDRVGGKKKITWVGKFSQVEKNKLLDFFVHNQKEFSLVHLSDILKTDLNGDGIAEYVMHLHVKERTSSFLGRVLAVVTESKDAFQVMVVNGPMEEMDIEELHLRAVDIDNDGWKEITEETIGGYDPEDPRGDYYHSAVYRNEHMRFVQIYDKKRNYDYLRFEDLDKNEKLEVLETVNDLPYETYMQDAKWRWINVYEIEGNTLKKANPKYLSFYLKKEKEYEALLKEAVEKDAEFKKKGKRTIYETAVKAMKAYLQRIDEMKKQSSGKK